MKGSSLAYGFNLLQETKKSIDEPAYNVGEYEIFGGKPQHGGLFERCLKSCSQYRPRQHNLPRGYTFIVFLHTLLQIF